MKNPPKDSAARVLGDLQSRAPEWIASGRLKGGRKIGLTFDSASIIVWQDLDGKGPEA